MAEVTGLPLQVKETGPALRYMICAADGFPLAITYGQTGQDADARLFAAAPELLAALEALHACHRAFSGNENWTMLDDEARALAEAAIAKAKGN